MVSFSSKFGRLTVADVSTQSICHTLDPKSVALVIDPAGFSNSGKLVDSDFKIFQLEQGRRYVEVLCIIKLTKENELKHVLQPLDQQNRKK